MIIHLVVLTWHPEVTAEQIAAVDVALSRLPEQIPELIFYSAGPNLHLRDPGGDYAVCALVRAEDLARYLDHPAHVDAVQRVVAPLIAERSAAQLRIDPGAASAFAFPKPERLT